MRETARKQTILARRLDQILRQLAFCFPRNFPLGNRPATELFKKVLLFSANGNKHVQMAVVGVKAGRDVRRRRKYVFTLS
jgi:hypothetical protein